MLLNFHIFSGGIKTLEADRGSIYNEKAEEKRNAAG